MDGACGKGDSREPRLDDNARRRRRRDDQRYVVALVAGMVGDADAIVRRAAGV